MVSLRLTATLHLLLQFLNLLLKHIAFMLSVCSLLLKGQSSLVVKRSNKLKLRKDNNGVQMVKG